MNQNDMSRRLRSWMVDAGWTLDGCATDFRDWWLAPEYDDEEEG